MREVALVQLDRFSLSMLDFFENRMNRSYRTVFKLFRKATRSLLLPNCEGSHSMRLNFMNLVTLFTLHEMFLTK